MSDENERRTSSTELLSMIKTVEKEVTGILEILNSEAYIKRTQYLDYLIDKEKNRAALRKAIIEKTLSSLIWSLLVGASYAIYHTYFSGK